MQESKGQPFAVYSVVFPAAFAFAHLARAAAAIFALAAGLLRRSFFLAGLAWYVAFPHRIALARARALMSLRL